MSKTEYNYTPAQRFEALAYYFGWTGGTVHQIEEATGCRNITVLPLERGNLDGFCAIRTCDTAWRCDVLAPRHRGEWTYWSDAIRGYWATGALAKAEV